MNLRFTPLEARVLGCLIEKEITTPDQYPLSLHALLAACNQKSNREPVLSLAERELQAGVEALQRRHLVVEKSGFGSRVPKYQHRLCNTEFGTLHFDPQELAILCELLLRGPQTPGELRSRAARMASFADAAAVEQVLERLASRADGPFVRRLAREPGRREARYADADCLRLVRLGRPMLRESAALATSAASAATTAASMTTAGRIPTPAALPEAAPHGDAADALSALERRLEELEARITQLELAQR
ncbi:MAG: YceH family protein [Sinobacteraceae bacterium]|nr:YceH family protein [Nevskiaceae bacterium]